MYALKTTESKFANDVAGAGLSREALDATVKSVSYTHLPHFPRRIFIFDKGRLFIFESEGYFDPQGVVHELSLIHI